MTKRLISFFLTLVFLVAVPLSATYKYNPYTRKLDYYERVADADLGDLGDVTLTGLAMGNILYYDGVAWVNLATGANTEFLTLAAGIPAWAVIPAGVTTFLALTDTPGAYAGKAGQLVRVNAGANALEFFAGSPLGTVIIADGAGGWTKTENYRVSAAGAVTLGSWTATAVANAYVAGINQNLLTTSTPTFDDLTISTPVNIYGLSHNSFADYAANRHVVLPNTLANVLSDHNLAAHTALGLFDASSDVDHDATTNYLAAQHLTLPAGIAAVLTDHDKAAHDALLIDADTVDGEHAAAIVTNARVKTHFPDTIVNVLSDHNLLAHTALGLFDSSGDVDHDLTTNYAANQHVVLPGTIVNVLSDHTLLVHTTLGLFDASSDVDHDLTTNYVANKHIDHTAVSIGVSGLISGGGTIASDRTITLTEATIEATIDTLANLTSIQAQTVTFSGSLNVEANSNINQDVTSDASPTFNDLTISTPSNIYSLSHNSFADYAANQHVVLPGTIANVLSDHNIGAHTGLGLLALPDTIANVLSDHTLLVHTTLGLFDASSDVDHDLTTNYAANQHVVLPGTIANVLSDHNLAAHTGLGLFDASSDVDHNATTNYFIYNHVGEDHVTDHNLWIGYLAGEDLAVGGQYNTLVGEEAGKEVTTGDDNVIIGYQAGYKIETGSYNVYVGKEVAYERTDGNENVIIGWQAGYGAATSTFNNVTIVGTWAGYSLNLGDENNLFGAYAASELTNGADNCVFGTEAMYYNETGHYNVVIGNQAGMGASGQSYDYNVIIGTQAAKNITTGSGNVIIGYWAGEGWLIAQNDLLIIDNSDTATPLIYGDFAADFIRINGELKLPDNKIQTFGDGEDASLEYDEATNDALIIGVPSTLQRGIILCDIADIAADFSGVVPAYNFPHLTMVDADIDSSLTIGFFGDDTPSLLSFNDPLHLNWNGDEDVKFFASAEVGENPYVYTYGWDFSDVGIKYARRYIDTAGKLNFFAQEAPIIFNQELRVPVSTDDVANPPTDAELDATYGTPATVGAGFCGHIDDNGAGNNFYYVVSDGTNWWIFTGAKAI